MYTVCAFHKAPLSSPQRDICFSHQRKEGVIYPKEVAHVTILLYVCGGSFSSMTKRPPTSWYIIQSFQTIISHTIPTPGAFFQLPPPNLASWPKVWDAMLSINLEVPPLIAPVPHHTACRLYRFQTGPCIPAPCSLCSPPPLPREPEGGRERGRERVGREGERGGGREGGREGGGGKGREGWE